MANSKENTPTGSPSPSEENLSDSLPGTIDKSLPAEGRDKPVPTRNPSFSPQRSVSPRRSTSPQRSPPPRKDESPLRPHHAARENLPRATNPAARRNPPRARRSSNSWRISSSHSPTVSSDLPPRAERVNRRLDEVDSKVHRATSSAPELTKALADTRRSPLTRRLRQIELHERVRLKIDSYTGEEDPKKWLTAFNLAMRREKYKSYDEREANYCQVFVEHMAKDALTWFSNLPAESIDNFDDLTNAFLKHYSMHMTRITRNMFTTTQTQGEPLRSFMERFKQAARDTGDMPIASR
ncbi:unnamed protein product [Microthlaspi erraticum]|uniref:Retrotransposon gag domain-containing protein n=1 Tax=Microthlaspi erraticum TaxID=1685480 RepID=A0A6D2KVX3_9BRAS|nr:unnamed protein product [Microthlaspi erraticum]